MTRKSRWANTSSPVENKDIHSEDCNTSQAPSANLQAQALLQWSGASKAEVAKATVAADAKAWFHSKTFPWRCGYLPPRLQRMVRKVNDPVIPDLCQLAWKGSRGTHQPEALRPSVAQMNRALTGRGRLNKHAVGLQAYSGRERGDGIRNSQNPTHTWQVHCQVCTPSALPLCNEPRPFGDYIFFQSFKFLYTWKLTPWVLLPRASCRMEMQILHERRQGPRSQGGGDLLSDLARAKSDFCSSRHRFPLNSAKVSGARPSKEGRSPMFSALTSGFKGRMLTPPSLET